MERVRIPIQIAFIILFVLGTGIRAADLIAFSRNSILSGTESVSKTICQRIKAGSSYLILGEFAEISPYLIKNKIIQGNPTAIIHAGEKKSHQLENKLKYLSARHSFLKHFQKNKIGADFYVTFPPGLKKSLNSNPSVILKNLMDPIEPDEVMIISLSPNARWYNEDYKLYHWPGDIFLSYLTENMNYSKSEVIAFQDIGIKLFVFNHNKNRENI